LAQSTPPEPSEVGQQRSIGAILRGRGDPVRPPHGDVELPAPLPAADEATVAPAPAGPESGANVAVDRDSLTQAWGDGVLHGLSARAKALYSAGRFVGSDGSGAQFALPNAAHRDRCLDRVAEVETALTAHFGTPIRLVLTVDGPEEQEPPSSNGPPLISGPGGTGGAGEATEAVLEEEDPAVFDTTQGADEQQASAVDRLLRTFPGASEIAE